MMCNACRVISSSRGECLFPHFQEPVYGDDMMPTPPKHLIVFPSCLSARIVLGCNVMPYLYGTYLTMHSTGFFFFFLSFFLFLILGYV